MKTVLLLSAVLAVVLSSGCSKAVTYQGSGVYYIDTRDGSTASTAMAELRAQHPHQRMEILEQRGRIGGNLITGSGAVTGTVGWIVILEKATVESKPRTNTTSGQTAARFSIPETNFYFFLRRNLPKMPKTLSNRPPLWAF